MTETTFDWNNPPEGIVTFGEDPETFLDPPGIDGSRRWLHGAIMRSWRALHPVPAEDWPEPTPLDAVERLAFPLDALPPVLANYVQAVATETSTPLDLAGLLALAAVATVVARRVEVASPWREALNLYVQVVLDVGHRKSPVMSEVFGPVEDIEQAEIERTAEARNAAKVANRAEIRRAKKAQTDALKEDAEPDDLEKAIEHERAARAKGEPATPRMMADDATPEAIEILLRDQHGRICIKSDEGGIFQVLAGRYAKGGTSPNLNGVLKGHDGSDAILVDRVGREHVRVERPTITFALTVQPRVLREFGENADNEGRGFCPRFVYGVPASNVGYRPLDIVPVPHRFRSKYVDLLTALHAAEFESIAGEPMLLELSDDADVVDDAAAMFRAFREDIEEQSRRMVICTLRRTGSRSTPAWCCGCLHSSTSSSTPRSRRR